MRIENSFDISLPPEKTYPFLLDLRQVASCVPGGDLGGQADDGSFQGTVLVRLGAMKLSYKGTVRVVDRDPEKKTATVEAEARDTKGQGSAKATTSMAVTERDGGSRVSIMAEVALKGRAAQMGAGIVQSVTEQMVGEVASCLEARLTAIDSEATTSVMKDRAQELPRAEAYLKVSPVLKAVIRSLVASLRALWDRLIHLKGVKGNQDK